MIKRRRTSAVPSSLTSQDAIDELNNANIYYSVSQTKAFDFKVYSSGDVRQSLLEIFHNKCAYCESNILTTGLMHVEHFRPKGAVKLDNGTILKPGYWWLAAEWSNLLPSCHRCNTSLNYEIDGNIKKLGKGNYFPLAINNHFRHAPIRGSEVGEDPLIIDPCNDDPMDYIEFGNNLHEKESIVKTKNSETDPSVFLKGKYSIEYYGLNRHELVITRIEAIYNLVSILNNVSENIEDLNEATTYKKRKKHLKRLMRNFHDVFANHINHKSYYFQAKFTYFMDWTKQYPEASVQKFIDQNISKIM